MRRHAPRPIGSALQALLPRLEPLTPLAAIQREWQRAVGEAVAREAQPVSVRDGVVTVGCESAVWAQELDLMSPAIVEGLNRALAAGEPPFQVRALRCVCGPRGGRL